MAINPMFRSTPTRLMGLSSGMDTESIIQATLRMHQFKIDNQMRNKTLIEWKQQYHNDIKKQIQDLKGTFLSNLGAKTLMNRNSYNASVAKVTTASGKASTAVTITTNASSSLGTLTINQVISLAKGASLSTQGNVSSDGKGFSTSATLGSLNGNTIFSDAPADQKTSVKNTDGINTTITKAALDSAAWTDGEFKMNINGKDVTLTKSNADGSISYLVTDPENGDAVVDSGTNLTPGTLIELGDDRVMQVTQDTNGAFSFYTMVRERDENGVLLTDEFDNQLYTAKSKDTAITFKSTANVAGEEGIVKLDRTDTGAAVTVKNGDKTISDASFYSESALFVNGKEITLSSNMTINDMIAAVNKQVPGVTMSYDRLQDKFIIESKTIEEGNTDLSVTGDMAALLFGGATVQESTEAKILLGDNTTVTSKTNSFDYRGINIKLNHVTEGATIPDPDTSPTATKPNPAYDPITVTVERDVTKPLEAIKDFINNYNALISKLEGLLNERKKTNEVSYKPLTDEEKSAMTEKQIEEWEAIAKKGILRSDRGIQDLVSNLRASFFKEIEGMGMSASQLGLTTGPYIGGTGGQIMIDEDKLKAALEEDPDKVADMFIKIGTDANGNPEGKGLLHKINGLLDGYIGTGKTQSITMDALERSLKEANERLAKMEERMWAEEDKLYRQFAAMETALSKMQSQGDWFTAMLGG